MQRLTRIAVRVADEIGDSAPTVALAGLCLHLFIASGGRVLWPVVLCAAVLAVTAAFARRVEADVARQVEAAREQGRDLGREEASS